MCNVYLKRERRLIKDGVTQKQPQIGDPTLVSLSCDLTRTDRHLADSN